jgi:anti-anti-sigma factor
MHDIVTYSEVEGNLICKFSGKLDTVVSQVIENDVINHIQVAHLPTIFDLKDVSYVSSSFLRVSISSARVTPNMKIKVINAIPDIKEIYRNAGLSKIFMFE